MNTATSLPGSLRENGHSDHHRLSTQRISGTQLWSLGCVAVQFSICHLCSSVVLPVFEAQTWMMDHWQRAELEHLVELMQGDLAGSPSHIATEQLLQQCLCRIPQEAAADAGAAEKRQRRVALADEEAAAARAHADEVAARADAWEAELCRLRAARGEVVTVVPSTPHSPCNAIAAAAAQPASLLHRSLQLHSLAQAIWLAAPLAAEGDLGVTTKDVNEDTNALGSLLQDFKTTERTQAADFEAETASRGEEAAAEGDLGDSMEAQHGTSFPSYSLPGSPFDAPPSPPAILVDKVKQIVELVEDSNALGSLHQEETVSRGEDFKDAGIAAEARALALGSFTADGGVRAVLSQTPWERSVERYGRKLMREQADAGGVQQAEESPVGQDSPLPSSVADSESVSSASGSKPATAAAAACGPYPAYHERPVEDDPLLASHLQWRAKNAHHLG